LDTIVAAAHRSSPRGRSCPRCALSPVAAQRSGSVPVGLRALARELSLSTSLKRRRDQHELAHEPLAWSCFQSRCHRDGRVGRRLRGGRRPRGNRPGRFERAVRPSSSRPSPSCHSGEVRRRDHDRYEAHPRPQQLSGRRRHHRRGRRDAGSRGLHDRRCGRRDRCQQRPGGMAT
jgi:hypothetical protein